MPLSCARALEMQQHWLLWAELPMVLVQGRCVYMYVCMYDIWHTCTCMECAVSGLREWIVLDAYSQ